MHDIKAIRRDPDAFDRAMERRGADVRAADLLALDERRVANTQEMNDAQARQKAISKRIGALMGQGDREGAEAAKREVAGLKDAVKRLEDEQRALDAALREALLPIPNVMDEDVPDGADEDDNVELRRWGTPREIEGTEDHVALGEALGMMDFEAAAKLSSSRFVVLKRDLAKLERALATFMLGLHTEEFGYEEVSPPVLVLPETMQATGQLPKFSSDAFSAYDLDMRTAADRQKTIQYVLNTLSSDLFGALKNESETVDILIDIIKKHPVTKPEGADAIIEAMQAARLGMDDNNTNIEKHLKAIEKELGSLVLETSAKFYLAPTAEVTLTNLVRETILSDAELPRRMTAWTQCFRAEAGSAGRDTRGMIRMHQFSKVELVSVTTPEQSDEEHERMTQCAEEVLKRLDLPFRTMLLCAGDTGFGAAKTYDLEVWLPGQDRYREISSCSNTRAFQARRMDARYRGEGMKKPGFVHTLNGSGLAVGRTLVAVLENYQNPDGSISVPDALVPLMGKDKIERA